MTQLRIFVYNINEKVLMPELPEVETIANELRKAPIEGVTITSAEIAWKRTLATPKLEDFLKNIRSKTILSVGRRGKFLYFRLSESYTLFVHLRMTGRFSFKSGEHVRASLHLQDGRVLYYHDTRKFGRWFFVQDEMQVIGKLGPEPLDPHLTLKDFARSLHRFRRQLKPLLLDQTFLAGLGNIYVDEALWKAKLHPQRLASTISPSEAKALLKAIRHVLERGLAARGTTLGKGKANFYRLDGNRGSHQDVLYVFRRTGLPCPRCGNPIVRKVIAQRSTHFCPSCQS